MLNLPLGAGVAVHPDLRKLPGGDQLQLVTDGAAGMVLLFALLSFFVGLGLWLASKKMANSHLASQAKGGAAAALVVAFLAGAAGALVNFASDLGDQVKAPAASAGQQGKKP
jgi:Family of unknown function (DUF6112)